MTLVQIAEYLLNNNQMVYDNQGNSLFDRGMPFNREMNSSLSKLHSYYSVGKDGRLSTLGVEGNVMFCLLVNESTK